MKYDIIAYLYDRLKLLQFDLQHFVLSFQLMDLLLLWPVFDVVLQLETLPSFQLTLLLHLVQPVLQLINLYKQRRTDDEAP